MYWVIAFGFDFQHKLTEYIPCGINPKELNPEELCPKPLHLFKKLENLLLISMGFVLSLVSWIKCNQSSSSSFVVEN